jgi:hypothetical protein
VEAVLLQVLRLLQEITQYFLPLPQLAAVLEEQTLESLLELTAVEAAVDGGTIQQPQLFSKELLVKVMLVVTVQTQQAVVEAVWAVRGQILLQVLEVLEVAE